MTRTSSTTRAQSPTPWPKPPPNRLDVFVDHVGGEYPGTTIGVLRDHAGGVSSVRADVVVNSLRPEGFLTRDHTDAQQEL